MKNNYHDILEYIYNNEEAGIREISKIMVRRKNDYRDFYGLVALLHGGYIGFTGPVVTEPFIQAHTFQCYAQGEGSQYSGPVSLSSHNGDSYFYIGAKGIEYFHQRSEARKSWYIVAILSLIASIVSGVIVAKFSDNNDKSCLSKTQKITTQNSQNILKKNDSNTTFSSTPYKLSLVPTKVGNDE